MRRTYDYQRETTFQRRIRYLPMNIVQAIKTALPYIGNSAITQFRKYFI